MHLLHLQKEKKERKKSETEVEVDGTKELHVTLSPRTPGGDPPETEELIKALMVNINNTNNNHDTEFVSLAIKYFVHMKIHVESMRHISRRFVTTLIYPPCQFYMLYLAVLPLSFIPSRIYIFPYSVLVPRKLHFLRSKSSGRWFFFSN